MARKKQQRVRITVSIDPEVLEVFKQQAGVLGLSVGRTIGDWCADTVDAAQLVNGNIKRAKAAPAEVMRELQQLTRDTAGVLGEAARVIERRGGAERKPDRSRR